MKIVTWNANSIRIRLEILRDMSVNEKPDLIMIQETKVQDFEFPLSEIKSLGYDFVYFSGEKSYNGVAIISKVKLEDVGTIDLIGDGQKRHIMGKIGDIVIHNFYVPAGGDIPNPVENLKFDHKLKFMDNISGYFEKSDTKNQKMIILGDFNIAPLEQDVWSHKQLIDVVSHTEIEVKKMAKFQKSGDFIDVVRFLEGEEKKVYTWWSYRSPNWEKADKGRRLDHVFCTQNLAKNVKFAKILKHYRGYKSASDHAPLMVEFSV